MSGAQSINSSSSAKEYCVVFPCRLHYEMEHVFTSSIAEFSAPNAKVLIDYGQQDGGEEVLIQVITQQPSFQAAYSYAQNVLTSFLSFSSAVLSSGSFIMNSRRTSYAITTVDGKVYILADYKDEYSVKHTVYDSQEKIEIERLMNCKPNKNVDRALQWLRLGHYQEEIHAQVMMFIMAIETLAGFTKVRPDFFAVKKYNIRKSAVPMHLSRSDFTKVFGKGDKSIRNRLFHGKDVRVSELVRYVEKLPLIAMTILKNKRRPINVTVTGVGRGWAVRGNPFLFEVINTVDERKVKKSMLGYFKEINDFLENAVNTQAAVKWVHSGSELERIYKAL